MWRLSLSLSFKNFRANVFYSNNKRKKWRCKDSTYHVKKQKLRLNQNWPIVVEEERWDADALGIPKIELLCLLNSFYMMASLNLENFIHTKLNKNSWDKLVEINAITLAFSTVTNNLNYYLTLHTKFLCIFNNPILK